MCIKPIVNRRCCKFQRCIQSFLPRVCILYSLFPSSSCMRCSFCGWRADVATHVSALLCAVHFVGGGQTLLSMCQRYSLVWRNETRSHVTRRASSLIAHGLPRGP